MEMNKRTIKEISELNLAWSMDSTDGEKVLILNEISGTHKKTITFELDNACGGVPRQSTLSLPQYGLEFLECGVVAPLGMIRSRCNHKRRKQFKLDLLFAGCRDIKGEVDEKYSEVVKLSKELTKLSEVRSKLSEAQAKGDIQTEQELAAQLSRRQDEASFTPTEGKAEVERLESLVYSAEEFIENLTIDRLERCGWEFDLERLTADYKVYCKAEGDCTLDDYIGDLCIDELDAYSTNYSLTSTVCEYAGVSWDETFEEATNCFPDEEDKDKLYGFDTSALYASLESYFDECYSETFSCFVYSGHKMQEILEEHLVILQDEKDKEDAEYELEQAEDEHSEACSSVVWREERLAEKEEFEVALRDKHATLVMLTGDTPEYIPSDAFQAAQQNLKDAKEAEKTALNKWVKAEAKVDELTEYTL